MSERSISNYRIFLGAFLAIITAPALIVIIYTSSVSAVPIANALFINRNNTRLATGCKCRDIECTTQRKKRYIFRKTKIE